MHLLHVLVCHCFHGLRGRRFGIDQQVPSGAGLFGQVVDSSEDLCELVINNNENHFFFFFYQNAVVLSRKISLMP